MDWIQGVFTYIEKIWNFVYCFWDQLGLRLKDLFIGLYGEVVNMIIALLALIPIPASLSGFQWPVMPQVAQWAVFDLQLPLCLSMLSGAALVRVTKSVLKMVR